jgi:hypothetical protein
MMLSGTQVASLAARRLFLRAFFASAFLLLACAAIRRDT